MKKAQVEVLSVLIITGIVIALVGTAYFWGVPLIEKRTAVTDLSIAEKFILDLDKKIKEIANAGGGEAELEIPFGLVRVTPYDGNDKTGKNNITLEFISKQPLVLGTKGFLKTNNLDDPAAYGSEPRIIRMIGESSGAGYLISLNMHYRELYSDNDGFIIALYTGAGEKVGKNMVSISFINNTVMAGEASKGGNLILTYLQVRPV